ncbi:hypothetical protein CALVIDRAFT_540899 [Calocera viscosa TUFC12733]|uniref:Uncharacterized protein n=1 Tax=Calocera viscosa (strain TUFC12733) TaxID=1330018 RepID=A0A167I9X3_CALVF|nr:hypothetical protein CALVIDRAFT_540899 [Calocera viscosa TUFC12733]
MSVKSVAVVALLSAAALAYPTGRIQRRNEVASSDDVSSIGMRSDNDLYDAQEVFARDPQAEYARKVQEYTSLYNQWSHAFNDANHAMVTASNTINAQVQLKSANSPHYNAGTHSAAQAELSRQKKLMDTAKKNADNYHSKLASLKPPKARRSLDDLEDTQDVFARDPHAEYVRKSQEYTSLYNQWKHAFDDANHAMVTASNTINAQVQLKTANSPHYSAATHSQAQAELSRQKKLMDTAKKNADSYHSKLAALKPPKARRSLDDLEDDQDVFARDPQAEYARKVQEYTSLYNQWSHAFNDANHAMEYTSLYNQWSHAFNDANHAMVTASNTINAQVQLKSANSPHYNAATHSAAQAELSRQKKLMDTAKKNADNYHSKLASLKPPKARRSLDVEDVEDFELRSMDDLYDTEDVFARGDKHAEYQQKVQEYTDLYNQWKHAFDDANHAMVKASDTINAQVALKTGASAQYNAATHQAAQKEFTRQKGLLDTAKKNADSYHSKLIALKPPKVRRSLDDLYDIQDVFARGDKHAEYEQKVTEYTSLYNQWKHAFDDASHAMTKASDTINAQVALHTGASAQYNAATHQAAKDELVRQKKLLDTAKKNADDYHKKLAALKPPKVKRSLDFESLEDLD